MTPPHTQPARLQAPRGCLHMQSMPGFQGSRAVMASQGMGGLEWGGIVWSSGGVKHGALALAARGLFSCTAWEWLQENAQDSIPVQGCTTQSQRGSASWADPAREPPSHGPTSVRGSGQSPPGSGPPQSPQQSPLALHAPMAAVPALARKREEITPPSATACPNFTSDL